MMKNIGNNVKISGGSYTISHKINTGPNTTVTPSFNRKGNKFDLDVHNGVNTYSVAVHHQVNPATNVYTKGSIASNGEKNIVAGIKLNF